MYEFSPYINQSKLFYHVIANFLNPSPKLSLSPEVPVQKPAFGNNPPEHGGEKPKHEKTLRHFLPSHLNTCQSHRTTLWGICVQIAMVMALCPPRAPRRGVCARGKMDGNGAGYQLSTWNRVRSCTPKSVVLFCLTLSGKTQKLLQVLEQSPSFWLLSTSWTIKQTGSITAQRWC